MALLAVAALSAQGQTAPVSPNLPQSVIEDQRQQERQRALRELQERDVDVRLPRDLGAAPERLPKDETPCFRIGSISLVGERATEFQWALAAASGHDGSDSPIGRCLGSAGINLVLARLQRSVVARGYVTTRLLVGPQDDDQGRLAVSLFPGRISALRFDGAGSPVNLAFAVPARQGDLLLLQDIEQGLENLKRVPTAEADIRVESAKATDRRPGDSDLVIAYTQGFPLRATLSLDDGGTEATGKTQAGATLAWDNPLGLSDLFYASFNHDVFNPRGQGTSGRTVHYSVPHGRWLLSATGSQNRHHQSVAAPGRLSVYAGESTTAELKLSRNVYRDPWRKTGLSLQAFRRSSRNFIDDVEVGVQQRIVGGWELGLAHRESVGDATLGASVAYRRGTGALGALRTPQPALDEIADVSERLSAREEAFNAGTSRFGLWSTEITVNAPWRHGELKLRYGGLLRAQWNRTPLTPQERFAIGGRYTVRGFDGESSLLGERGALWRNELGVALAEGGAAELYVGIDAGRVRGPTTASLVGRRLVGGGIGLRGTFMRLNYDLFVGAPISKPEGYPTARIAAAFNLNYSF